MITMEQINFYKETNFKDTEIGKIPEDWEEKTLIDLAEYINGYAFSPKDWKKEGLPIIRIQNLNDDKAEFNYFDGELDKIKYLVNKNDLLFSWSATIDVFIWKKDKAWLNQHIFKVIPKTNVYKYFLFYLLKNTISHLKKKIHGSTMKHFKRKELATTLVFLPPKVWEQKAIAKVLKDFDDLLKIIDKQIKKLERIKKGLMNEYFTKGIFKREKFKDTEIGRIPEDWEVKRLGEVVEDIYYGVTAKATEKNTGIKMLRTTDIKNFSVDWDNLPYCEITDTKNNLQKYLLRNGDLIVARAGTVGVSVLVEKDFSNVIFGSYLIKVRLKPNIVPKFVYYFFQTSLYWSHITKAQGSTLKNINLPLLKSLLIPLPPLEEQKAIAERLKAIDDLIETKQKEKEHLERAKKKVMDLLLSGKVRIKN